jgi:hypothetical protein
MNAINRYYVETVSEIAPDQTTGNVKLTFAVEGKHGGDVVQLIVSVNKLNDIFQKVGEVMQSNFGGGQRPGSRGAGPGGGRGPSGGGRGGPGGPGGPSGRGGPGGPPQFKDLTE